MPTVRRLERQVTTTALPGVRKTAAATAESEGAGLARARGQLEATKAEGAAARAGAMANFADRVTQITGGLYAEMQESERRAADETALLEASNKLADFRNVRLFNPETGAFTRKGKDAMPLPEEVLGAIRELDSTRRSATELRG